jgi:hypothetical protein
MGKAAIAALLVLLIFLAVVKLTDWLPLFLPSVLAVKFASEAHPRDAI